MDTMASQITSLTIVYSTVYLGADQRKHQSSASLAFVWGIHRGPVNSPHKRPVTRKMFPFDDVIMEHWYNSNIQDPTITVIEYNRNSVQRDNFFTKHNHKRHTIAHAQPYLALPLSLYRVLIDRVIQMLHSNELVSEDIPDNLLCMFVGFFYSHGLTLIPAWISNPYIIRCGMREFQSTLTM